MLKDGDVIAFDYDLFVEGHEGPYDTTRRETAEKAGALDPNAFYAPMSYQLGAGRLIKGLEEALKTCEVLKAKTVELSAEEAYGPRDPKNIETLPMQEFRKNKIDPEVGLVITYKNRRGIVTYVGGGRIRVDFNHALAGKKLRYEVMVQRVAKTPADRVRGVIQMDYPTSLTWDVEVKGDEATVTVPDEVKFDRNFLVAKYRIITDLHKLAELKSLRLVEAFSLKETEAPAAVPPA
ncbi:MAG: FKBP-type peptidyl-prolyl cis-trans isomerase [Euryarchaeota archaeon]|nr:FKBP-type peptidyl-prolyl cis-trans isomerase [Euryarchaeota archaeon]